MTTRGIVTAMAALMCLGQLTTGGALADDTTSGATTLQPQSVPRAEKIRKSSTIAGQLAKAEWLDKAAEADPAIIASICAHSSTATILARHKHLGAIAQIDPYVCRRITRWDRATEVLLRNPDLDEVVKKDPQGIYNAIIRRPSYARLIAGHEKFYTMVDNNPDLGRVISEHMK